MDNNNKAKHIADSLVPQPSSAVQQFEGLGGHLTIFSGFGEDPLRNSSQLVTQREMEFTNRYPDFCLFFNRIVNFDSTLFRDGLLFFIDVSKRLEASI